MQSLGSSIDEKENMKKVKSQLCMIDSMTQDEITLKVNIDQSRQKRILIGSGCRPYDFFMMEQNLKQIKGMIQNFSKMNFGKDNMSMMMRNPKQMMEKLGQALNPGMIQQLGGMGNLMGMIKDLEGMEKTGQLNDINKILGGAMKGKKKR